MSVEAVTGNVQSTKSIAEWLRMTQDYDCVNSLITLVKNVKALPIYLF